MVRFYYRKALTGYWYKVPADKVLATKPSQPPRRSDIRSSTLIDKSVQTDMYYADHFKQCDPNGYMKVLDYGQYFTNLDSGWFGVVIKKPDPGNVPISVYTDICLKKRDCIHVDFSFINRYQTRNVKCGFVLLPNSTPYNYLPMFEFNINVKFSPSVLSMFFELYCYLLANRRCVYENRLANMTHFNMRGFRYPSLCVYAPPCSGKSSWIEAFVDYLPVWDTDSGPEDQDEILQSRKPQLIVTNRPDVASLCYLSIWIVPPLRIYEERCRVRNLDPQLHWYYDIFNNFKRSNGVMFRTSQHVSEVFDAGSSQYERIMLRPYEGSPFAHYLQTFEWIAHVV